MIADYSLGLVRTSHRLTRALKKPESSWWKHLLCQQILNFVWSWLLQTIRQAWLSITVEQTPSKLSGLSQQWFIIFHDSVGWLQNLKWSHISGDLSSMVGTARSLSPCVSHLQPQCSKRMRMVTAKPLLVRLATHFQGILLVKKVTRPAQKGWENWPYLWMGVVAKSLWLFLIYHRWPT